MIHLVMEPTQLTLITLVLYLAAEGLSIAHLRTDRGSLGHATTGFLLVGFLVHFASLYLGAKAAHAVPYHDLAASMSFFAWLVVGTYGFLLFRHREGAAGPFLVPIALLFLVVSLLTRGGGVEPSDPSRKGYLFAFHVTISILGYAALTLSFVLAQLYLIQNKQLRRHKLGLLFSRLPALDVLARLHRTAVATGVCALSLGMILGLAWARQRWQTFLDVKVAITLAVIAIYALTLIPRRLGWGGKRVALVSISGFLTVLFSYTIVNLYLSQGHTFR
jgi:ABC-type transport system involved in cytochrome c biogenesis permease subunit